MSKRFVSIDKVTIALWRSFNATLLLIGFAGPWFGIFGNLADGFEVTRFVVTGYLEYGIRTLVDPSAQPKYFWPDVFAFLIVTIGLINTWIYWVVNLLRILTGHKWKTVWSAFPLAVGAAGLITLVVYVAQYAYGGLNSCFWALRLVLGSLGSCALLEIVNHKLNQGGNNPTPRKGIAQV